MKIDAVVCKAETVEAYKKMKRYVYGTARFVRREYDCTFTYKTNPKDKTMRIKSNRECAIGLMEYCIRKYLQAHPNNGWDRTVECPKQK